MRPYKIFAGNSNPELAREICAYIGTELGDAKVGAFSDGEIRVEINESVRGADVYVIQSTCAPVNHNLMELLIMLDACKRASAGSISAVVPYFGYARQDRKAAPRAPISARLVTDLITAAGADRIITMELHAGQIQGFFNGPVDHLYSSPVLLEHLAGFLGIVEEGWIGDLLLKLLEALTPLGDQRFKIQIHGVVSRSRISGAVRHRPTPVPIVLPTGGREVGS
jgi:ribose-phosphate pyrophosphokinase